MEKATQQQQNGKADDAGTQQAWRSRLAAWMQRMTERLSVNMKITLWFGCSILAGGYSSWLVIGGLSGKAQDVLLVTPIKVPSHISSVKPDGQAQISAIEMDKLERFLAYMDSLARSPTGKPEYERIIRERPGLLDSIRAVEHLYRLQSGKR